MLVAFTWRSPVFAISAATSVQDPFASADVVRQVLVSIAAAEVGVLAISFSLALFVIQVSSQASSYRTLQLYLNDPALRNPFITVSVIAIATLSFAFLPLWFYALHISAIVGIFGLALTIHIIWRQFSTTSAHADPGHAIGRWFQRARSTIATAPNSPPSSAIVVRGLSFSTGELEDQLRASSSSIELRAAQEIVQAFDEILDLLERLATGSDRSRFADALRSIVDLIVLIHQRFIAGITIVPRGPLDTGTTLDPFMSDRLELLNRIYTACLRRGDIARSREIIDAYGRLLRALQDAFYA